MKSIRSLTCLLLVLAIWGCEDDSEYQEWKKRQLSDEQLLELIQKLPDSEPTERDLEFIRWYLSGHDHQSEDRIYFLTPTPQYTWGETGDWKSFSPEFHELLSEDGHSFLSAEDAAIDDSKGSYQVYQKETKAEAWMEWITILKWNSPTEVMINSGVWCCQLGGGQSVDVYERIEGEWHFKENLLSHIY